MPTAGEGEDPMQIWLVLAPTSIGSRVQLPAPWAPTAFATMDVGMVAFVEADWLGSYRALRRQVGLTCVFDGPATLLPATGDATARTSAAGGRL